MEEIEKTEAERGTKSVTRLEERSENADFGLEEKTVFDSETDEIASRDSAETIAEEASSETPLKTAAFKGEIVLEAEGLTKSYTKYKNGKKTTLYALKDVGFTVRAGEVVGFLGPNGAGKSTAIKLVTGLAKADAGRVTILGRDVFKNRKAAIGEVGGVIESPDLYSDMSAEEMMNYFAGLYPDETFADAGNAGDSFKIKRAERIEKLIRLVGLESRKKDKIKTYSLGMKQRLGIAQALLNKPRLLILDEPANGLDPSGIREIREIIKTLAKEMNIAVLVSSHQLSEMDKMCDRVVILLKGRKAAEGSVAELMEKVSKRRVHIKTSDPQAAIALFRGKAGVVAVVEQGGVLLQGEITAGDAAKELVLNGIPISGVGEDAGNLEELFFMLTKEGSGK